MTVDKGKSRSRVVSRSNHFMYHVQTRCHRNIQSIIKQILNLNRIEMNISRKQNRFMLFISFHYL